MTGTWKRGCRTARRGLWILVATGVVSTTPCFAWQRSWRTLTGTVTDGHREPLRGAVIQVHNEADDSVISYITGRTGRYVFKRLAGDADYRVSATYQGHTSKTREMSHFDSKETKVIDLKIKME
jgi:hypothetical protein